MLVRLAILMTLALCLTSVAAGQAVSGEITGPVKKGRTAKASVVLDLPAELHTNSHRPSGPYLIPTTVTLTGKGIQISAVKYPSGHDRKFEFAERPLNVYQGKVVFNFQITVPRSYRGKNISVDAAIRYQACTDEVCYPPKTKSVTLTASVR